MPISYVTVPEPGRSLLETVESVGEAPEQRSRSAKRTLEADSLDMQQSAKRKAFISNSVFEAQSAESPAFIIAPDISRLLKCMHLLPPSTARDTAIIHIFEQLSTPSSSAEQIILRAVLTYSKAFPDLCRTSPELHRSILEAFQQLRASQ